MNQGLQWLVKDRKDIHVLPIGDLREHVEARECWCRPRLTEESGSVIVSHNAADGRELVEKHGIN